MKLRRRAPHGALLALAAVLAALAIAACGGSGASRTTTSKNASSATATKRSSSRTALAVCLKKHGVTPPRGTGGFGRRPGNGPPPAGGG
ncbi:MAG: hypothetical protein KGL16_13475, partial [Acidobacteriota bacterium]|nr:hypothetical protein [Acidobacteriota bacterium]